MGEYAEMALEGCICQWCGEMIGDGEGVGYAMVCGGCQRQHNVDQFGDPRKGRRGAASEPARSKRTIKCTVHGCNRGFASEAARDQHLQDRHKRHSK